MAPILKKYLPILDWGARYSRADLSGDLIAAVIVTIMLIPQSLAYALLAGMPPEAGIYASIVPIVFYALFGTSRSLAVGPVAVVSLMTAAAIGEVAEAGSAGYAVAALTLAGLSGAMLLVLGILRLGFLANFLSHPVIAGFITASGILIAVSQLRHILGIEGGGSALPQMLTSLLRNIGDLNIPTVILGASAVAFLFWVRKGLKPLLERFGLAAGAVNILAKAGPVLAIALSTAATAILALGDKGVAIVGTVPQGLPPLTLPHFAPDLISALLLPALLISVIGFVESISVAQTLAAKKRQRIDPDQELIGLGAANIGAALTGGFPVSGGFARSVVNYDAGAETPAAGAYTAAGLLIASLFLTPLIFYLPKATLAATIIVAVLSLVDLSILRRTWVYSKADFAAVFLTIALTLGLGVEVGVSTGVVVSIFIHLYRSSQPHMAVVGRVPGTEHFRNIDRHKVETRDDILSLRVDESLYFANARVLEERIYDMITRQPAVRHVILMCPAVNAIDMSALESLEAINTRLSDLAIKFHLSEVKGPVMDRLQRSSFLAQLTGQVFLSHHQAVCTVSALSDRPAATP